jgi:hypothetical protein
MTVPALDTAAVGQPITRLGVSFFPVYLPENRIPRIAAGPGSGLVVGELDNPSVPHLKTENPTDTPILVIEGEHFLGGLQDRTANATVLVPPYTTLEIPVTCLEAGRWGPPAGAGSAATTARHERSHGLAPPEVRRNVRASVNRSFEASAAHRVDQSAAWQAVAGELRRRGAPSPTQAAREAEGTAFRRHRSRRLAAEELERRGPLPRQSGVCIAHGPRVRAVEIFGAPSLLRAYWRGIVRAYLADPATAPGQPSAERALWGARRMTWMKLRYAPGLGLGTEVRAADDVLAAVVLLVEGGLVHQSALFAD